MTVMAAGVVSAARPVPTIASLSRPGSRRDEHQRQDQGANHTAPLAAERTPVSEEVQLQRHSRITAAGVCRWRLIVVEGEATLEAAGRFRLQDGTA